MTTVGTLNRIPRNQHFVPQFLLRYFAWDERRRRVRVFRIDGRQHIDAASIKGQCARHNFYGADGKLETAFSRLEGAASEVVRGIIERGVVPAPYTTEHDTFLVFIALQWGRTPAAAERQNEQLAQFARQFVKSHPKLPPGLRPHLDKVRIQYQDAIGVALEMASLFGALMGDLRVKVLKNDTKLSFIISDSPVVFHNQWCRRAKGIGSIGLACSGLQIFLPLSPDHLAILYDTDVYRVGPSADDVVPVTSEDEVRSLNALQYAAAEGNLYYRAQAMAAEVAAISPTCRSSKGIRTHRFEPADGRTDPSVRSELIVTSWHSFEVDIRWGAITLRDDARIPLRERVQRWRPEARALADLIHPPPESESGPRHSRYRRIVED